MKKIPVIALLLAALASPARASGQVEFNAATGASSGAYHVQHISTTHTAAGVDRLVLVGLGLGSDVYNPNVNCEYGGIQMEFLTYSGGVQGGYTMYALYLFNPPTGAQIVYCDWPNDLGEGYWARMNAISLTGAGSIFGLDEDCCTGTFAAGAVPGAPLGSLAIDFLLVGYPGPVIALGGGQTLNVDAFAWQKTHMLSSRKYAEGAIEMGETWQNYTTFADMTVVVAP